MIDALNPMLITSATQWFERTLDDSANKRLSIPEGFLAIDGILDLCLNVVDGLVVYPKVIEKAYDGRAAVYGNGKYYDGRGKGTAATVRSCMRRSASCPWRQERMSRKKGKDNNLLELIAADPEFNLTLEQLQATMEPSKYVGRAPVQVDAFLANVVNPVLEKNQDELGVKAEINV